MDTTKTTHISLCSGYGGIDLGLRRVLPDVRTIAYVEIESFACANLVEKMESKQLDAAPIWTNLKTFNAKPFRNRVDILSGGFPCQPFSHAGQRKGTEDPRHLFPDIERIIMECEPSILFLENVEGIIPAKYQGEPDTSVLKYVLERLEKMGYRAEAGVFSAIECGAPHQRKRVFIAGVRNISDTDCIRHGGRSSEGCADGERFVLQGECERSEVGSETQGCCKLADTRRDKCVGWSSVGGNQESDGRKESQGQGSCEGGENKAGKWALSEPSNECAEVGDTAGHGCDKGWSNPEARGIDRQSQTRGLPESEGGCCEFPSRPKEEQQPWEAPRTIGSEEVITAMGGAAYGVADGNMVRAFRVDSLRLLGNGVVPIVASKAFTILMARLNKG